MHAVTEGRVLYPALFVRTCPLTPLMRSLMTRTFTLLWSQRNCNVLLDSAHHTLCSLYRDRVHCMACR
jgi:hypothetical protein